MQVWPVRYHEVEAAADVPVTGLADRLLLRARGPVVIHVVLLDLVLERQTRAGAASPDLLERIERAAAHVAETEQVIRRWAADREHRRTRCQPSTMVW